MELTVKKKAIGLICLLAVVCLLVALIAVASALAEDKPTAAAAETAVTVPISGPVAGAAEHDAAFGAGSFAACKHDGATPLTASGWEIVDNWYFGLPTGHYYLTENITLTKMFRIVSGATVDICLNGYIIDANDKGYGDAIFYIKDGATLRVFDHEWTAEDNRDHYYTVGSDGEYVFSDTASERYIRGGVLTGGEGSEGSVFEVNGGTNCYFYGGAIAGNHSDNGGAIRCSGNMEISGGLIAGNRADTYGGAIILYSSSLLVKGGIITDNVGGTAGGIYMPNNNRMQISGNPIVSGNRGSGGSPQNIYLEQPSESSYIDIVGELTEGAEIGFETVGYGYVTKNFGLYNSQKNALDYFKSDNSAKVVTDENGDVAVQVTDNVWVKTEGHCTAAYGTGLNNMYNAFTIPATKYGQSASSADVVIEYYTDEALTQKYEGVEMYGGGWRYAFPISTTPPGTYYLKFICKASPLYNSPEPLAYDREKSPQYVCTITERKAILKINDKTAVYGDAEAELTAEVKDADFLTGDSLSTLKYELSRTGETNVGVYDITITDNDPYYNITFVNEQSQNAPGKYTITPRPLSVKLDDLTSVYGETLKDFSYTPTEGTIVGDDVLNITYEKFGVDVGEYAITGTDNDPNYELTITPGKYTITQRPVTILIDDKESEFGSAVKELTFKLADGSTLAYAETESDLNVTLTKAEGSNADTYAITGAWKNANYAVMFVDGTYTIKPKGVGVIWATDTFTYNGTDQSAGISASYTDINNNTVALNVNKTTVAAFKDAGTYDFEVDTSALDANYTLISGQTKTYTISPRPVTVTIADKTSVYGETKAELTSEITAGSVLSGEDLGITLRMTDTNAGGTYDITGTAANTNYDVTFINGTYTITQKSISVTIDSKTSVYGASLEKLTFTLDEGSTLAYSDTKDDLKITLKKADGIDIGGYEISGVDNDGNYEIAFTPGLYTITKATNEWLSELTISDWTYGESAAAPNIQAKVGEVEYTYSDRIDGEYTTVKPTNAGTYYVKAKVTETDNYAGLPITDAVAFTIAKADYDMSGVVFENVTAIYNGNAHSVEVTGHPAGVTVSYDAETSYTNAGTYTIKATFTAADTKNYNALSVTEMSATLTIEKADYDMSEVKFENVTVKYNGSAHSVEVTGLPAGVSVKYDKETSYTNAGKYTIKATFTAADTKNYNALTLTEMTATLTIEKADYDMSEVKFENVTVKYNGSAHSVEVTGLPAGVSVKYDKETSYTNAGTYTIKATFTASDTKNYNELSVTEMSATLTINKADYDISGAAWDYTEAFTYDGAVKTVKITGLPKGVTVTEYTGNTATNAGDYTASVTSFTYDKINYNAPTFDNLNWKINRATYNMSGAAWNYTDAFTYDGTVKSVRVTDLPKGVTAAYTGNTATNAGEYTASVTFTYDETNYNAPTIADLNWAIERATYDMRGAAWDYTDEFTYDGSAKTVKVTGLPTGVTAAYTGNTATNAGDYTASVTFTYDETNYNAPTIADLNWAIERATYNMSGVAFENVTVKYNGNAHSVEVTGLPAGVTVSYDAETSYTNAGTYTIKATFTAADTANYNALSVTEKTATLTIEKADYDMSDVAFESVTAIYNGNAHSVEVTGLPTGVSVEYDKETSYTNAGKYTIKATFTAADTANYNALSVTEKTATLTINKATYDMSGIGFADMTVTYDGESHSLAITGTLPAGVTVTYENNGKTEAGEYTVTAKFTGDATNYEAIANKVAKLTIKAVEPAPEPTPEPTPERGGCGSIMGGGITLVAVSLIALTIAAAYVARKAKKK